MWILCCALLRSAFAMAEPLSSSAVTALLECRAIAEPVARLACFDRESSALATAGLSPSATPLTPAQRFGLAPEAVAKNDAGRRGEPRLDALEARITGLSVGASGRVVFTLDTDQSWQQVMPDGDLLLKLGDRVTLRRALLGSYFLQAPTGRTSRVTRVR